GDRRPGGVHALPGGDGQGRRRHTYLRQRRRRDERQHPDRALRRSVLGDARVPRQRRAAGPGPDRGQALRGRGHRGRRRVPARRRPPRRPGRRPRHRCVLPQHGQQLQPRAPAAGGRRGRRTVAGARTAGDGGRPRGAGRGMRAVRRALLGCGPVGSQVVRLRPEQAEDLAARVGVPVELAGIAVRRLERDRGDLPVDRSLFTTDALGLVKRDDVDVVVEVVGGIEPARTWLVEALRRGKGVVTANKALLAEDGGTLHEAAVAGGADPYFEAAVAAGIPLLRPLRESLHGDRITRVTGIVNGTTNYILSAMDAAGTGYAEALEEATALGYAEADPTADVEGFDAAAKAAILAS